MGSTFGDRTGRRPKPCGFLIYFYHGSIFIPNISFYTTTRSECYDYLFSIAVEMKKAGIDPEKFEST